MAANPQIGRLGQGSNMSFFTRLCLNVRSSLITVNTTWSPMHCMVGLDKNGSEPCPDLQHLGIGEPWNLLLWHSVGDWRKVRTRVNIFFNPNELNLLVFGSQIGTFPEKAAPERAKIGIFGSERATLATLILTVSPGAPTWAGPSWTTCCRSCPGTCS